MRMTEKRGFTLIELLVVVLIIGVLAAVALPQYNKAVKKAQGREALATLDVLDKAMQAYYLEHGTYQDITADKLNIDLPELTHFSYNVGTMCNTTARPTHQFTDEVWFGNGSNSKQVFLCSPAMDVTVNATWRQASKQFVCQVDTLKKDGIGCEMYFDNCNESRVYHPATSSYNPSLRRVVTVPAHYTHKDCILNIHN